MLLPRHVRNPSHVCSAFGSGFHRQPEDQVHVLLCSAFILRCINMSVDMLAASLPEISLNENIFVLSRYDDHLIRAV